MLTPNPVGGYSFVRGGGPYSSGVIADAGFTFEHIRLSRPLEWRDGFEYIDAHLRNAGRPRAALCSIALRAPKPFTFEGFAEFNRGYIQVLRSMEMMVDGINPIARTNVAPEVGPPAVPSLYSFAYTVPGSRTGPCFAVAGAGEISEGSPGEVVRPGDTSPEGMAEKARFVMGLLEARMKSLGVSWNDVTDTNVYTVHGLRALLPTEILPRMGDAAVHGLTWHYSRPPIDALDFEMDVRGAC